MPRASRLKLILLLVSLSCSAGPLPALTVSARATLTITGAETPSDRGDITVSFNGFVESVSYGQYSTPASLASAFAAMFTRDYHQYGLWAKAGANGSSVDPQVVTLQLTNGDSFGPISFVGPATSFGFSETGFTSTPPADAPGNQTATGPLITSVSPNTGVPGSTSVILTGQNFGSSAGTVSFNGVPASASFWSTNTITVTAPASTTTGPIVVSVGGVNSNGVLFRIAVRPVSCPVN